MSYPWNRCVSCWVREGAGGQSHLDGLPPEDEEGLGALCQEAGKLVDQNMLDLIRLFDLDAYAHAVDAGFDQDSFIFISGNCQGI